jgi:di/tricarboxylate transporter
MSLKLALGVADQVRTQSLTSIVGGFSFAAAIAWMDAVRWMISQVVKVQKNGGTYYVLTALFTTLLAVVAYTLINMAQPDVERPDQPMFAIARA